jgi:MFS family permease
MANDRGAVRRLALALFVSSTMSEAAWIALAFNVYRRTGSGIWLAAVFLLTLGIPGLLTPVGGAIADRFDRRKVMVMADAGAAAAFCVLIFTQEPSVMLVVAFVAAVVERPFGPALRASVPNLVDPDDLTRANSTLSLGWKLGVVVGATAGGVLFERYGPAWVFGLNAASFLVSSGLIASIRAPFSATSAADDREDDDDRGALAGFRFIRRRAVLSALLVAWALLWLGVDM